MTVRGGYSVEHWVVAVMAVALGIVTLAGKLGASARHEVETAGTPRISHSGARAAPPRVTHRAPARPVPAAPGPAAAQPPPLVPRAAPTHQVAIGAYIPGATRRPGAIAAYAHRTGRPPALIVYYRTWKKGQLFDPATLGPIAQSGAIPVATWEPWGAPLDAIARGDYDGYIRSQARAARRFGGTILLRFAHEMNGDWYPWGAGANTPDTYIAAWRHMVRLFRREGARNVRWMWAPNAEHESQRLILSLYPGDRWVDWVGLSGFDWGGPWLWESAGHVFRNSYRALTNLTKKPLMIVETGAGEVGGDKAKWIAQAFGRDFRQMPRVRAIVWFNGRSHWAHWDVDSSAASLKAFRTAVSAARYGGVAADVEQLSGVR